MSNLNQREITSAFKDVKCPGNEYRDGRFYYETVTEDDLTKIAADPAACKLACSLLNSQLKQHQFSTFAKSKLLAFETDKDGNPTTEVVEPPKPGVNPKAQCWIDAEETVRLNWGYVPGGRHESGVTEKQYAAILADVATTVSTFEQIGSPISDDARQQLIDNKVAELLAKKA
jgi:hypothetical protein